MIGSIIGGVVGAAGSIFGGITGSRAAKKRKQALERQKQKNQNWYDRRMNEDATQRADAQRVLTRTEEMLRDRNASTEGMAAVSGGTDESVAAAKAANNKVISDTMSQIAAKAADDKDRIEQKYMDRDAQLDSQLGEIEAQNANAIGQAVQGVGQAASSIISAF